MECSLVAALSRNWNRKDLESSLEQARRFLFLLRSPLDRQCERN